MNISIFICVFTYFFETRSHVSQADHRLAIIAKNSFFFLLKTGSYCVAPAVLEQVMCYIYQTGLELTVMLLPLLLGLTPHAGIKGTGNHAFFFFFESLKVPTHFCCLVNLD